MPTHTIDDRDGSIEYSQGPGGRWTQIEDENNFRGTATRTVIGGATARLTFRGTSVQVFGTIRPGRSSSSYSIDGSAPQKVRKNLDFASSKQNQQLLYVSPELDDGEHTLLITNLNDAFPLLLDFMVISTPSPLPPPPPPPPPTLHPSSSSLPRAPINTIPTSSAPSSPTTSTTQSFANHPTITPIAQAFAESHEGPLTGITDISSVTIDGLQTTVLTRNGTTVTTSTPYTTTIPLNSPLITFPGPLSTTTPLSVPSAASGPEKNMSRKFVIIGAIVGLIAVIGIVLCLACFWRLRKRKLRSSQFVPRPLLPTTNSSLLPTNARSEKLNMLRVQSSREFLVGPERSGSNLNLNHVNGDPTFGYQRPIVNQQLRSSTAAAVVSREEAYGLGLAIPGPNTSGYRGATCLSSSTNDSKGHMDAFDELPPYPGANSTGD